MSAFYQYFVLSAPLFAIVLAGYLLAKVPGWRREWTAWVSKLVFTALLPAMLFHTMSKLREMPPVNAQLLIAFFGGCFIVFFIGRFVAAKYFRMDGVAQSVFALAGIFSNNVLLGLPMAKLTIGPAAVPSVALVVVFNAFTLWTLVSISIEWAKQGSFTVKGFGKMTWGVLTSPLVAGIVLGTIYGLSGLPMPMLLDRALDVVSAVAAPGALLILGMGLVQYGLRAQLNQSLAICGMKLIVAPLVVWALAALLGLPRVETESIVLLASMSVGTNVYLMSMQFETLQGPVASSLVLSTAIAAFTTPAILALVAAL